MKQEVLRLLYPLRNMQTTKTPHQLNQMTDRQLHDYFCKQARYMADAPPNAKYVIRFGNCSLHSGDTKDLFEEFLRKVRAS